MSGDPDEICRRSYKQSRKMKTDRKFCYRTPHQHQFHASKFYLL